jgi:hypothetical protein
MAEEIINQEILPVEAVTYGDTDPKPKSYWKKIHENLVDAFGAKEVPDEVTFEKKIKDPKYAKLIHDNLVEAFGATEVPDYKSFTDSLTIVSPEKKNLGLSGSNLSGILSDPTGLPFSSTKNSVQQPDLVQSPDPFDKNANPAVLARQSYELKKPKQAKENVSVTAMGLPVISYDKKYDENDINISKEIDKYLEESGYSKDFINQVSRIPESYRQSTGYTDQELSDLYKNDRNSFNKRTSEVLFREELRNGMIDIMDSINKNTSLTSEEKKEKIRKIQDEELLQNQEAMSIGGGLKNKQYFIGQTAKRIKQFIADPEKQKEALQDLATYAADDFGNLEDLEDKKKNPISPNINEEQSVALNYLDQIDPDKAAFYKKYLDVDKNQLTKFEYKGYQQIFKELDEIGLNLSINSAQNEIKPLVDLAKQQGGILDPVDYEKYNKLLETINLASTRLAKIDQIYPDAKDLDTESIAQDLVGGRSSMLGAVGKKFMYNLGKTGKGIVDIAAAPFRTQQENDNAALEALGIENYIAPTTTPTSKNSLIARGEAKLTPELESQRQAIIKDKSLSQDEKVDKMIDLLERNPDKWIRPSDETSWNVGVNSITSSLLNFTADIAPFIALETLTAGGATPTAGYGLVSSFGKMFANVALTSYSDELARQLKEKNPNPELAAYSNILVNTIAYKLAGVGDIVKGIRGGAKELGGITEKIISKLDDKAILTALEKPNPTLKGFLSDFGKTVVQSGKKGFQTGLTFETVMGGKEALEGAKVDSEFIKSRLVGLLNFTLFNVATRTPLGMPKIDKQSKEALFLAATNRDQVLYEAEKSFANKQISESEYNQIKNNVDAAYKVLERVPMVNGKGEQLSRKEATELMYLKIQEQFIKDKADKDLPEKVKEKITKELSDVQNKINKVYKGEFIDDAGKPFAGVEDREAKRKIKIEEPVEKESVSTETKTTEVKVAEEINADAVKEPVIEEKGAEKKTLESELRDALSYDYYESQLNSEDQWERENAKKYLADPKKYFESKIQDAKDVLSNNPDNESSKNVLDNYTEKLRLFNEITNKYKQSTAKEPVIKEEAVPSEVTVTEEVEPTEIKSVEQLREQEQAELDSRIANAEQYRVDGKVDRDKLTNEADKKAYDEVWEKYNELIYPLLQKGKKDVKPVEVIEEATITAPDVEIPVTGEVKPTKTPEEVAISKKALGDNYGFSKDFDVRGGDVVATDVLTSLNQKAKKNNVDLDTQIANEVDSMAKRGVEPTEFNIVTAGSHLLNIDKKINAAQTRGDLLEVENLTEQRKQVLDVLRTLGNKAGRNLGLFNLVFQDVDASEIKTTRSYLKKVLNVDEVPETIADLNKSNLTAEQKKTVRPYVERIEKVKSQFEAVEKQVDKNIFEINNEEVNAAIEKARAEGKKEGLEEGMQSASADVKKKRSKKLKDLASQIRRSDEFDKFLEGSGPLGDVKKAGVVDLGSYKEIVANVLDAVATAVELGENVTEAIRKAAQKFADIDQGKLISDVKTIISKASLPSKKEAMDKISEIAKAKGVTGITKEMADQGLIKDVVNSYLGENLTNDKILEAATNDLKSILPSVTRENVSNAYVERGEFKKETKAKIEDKIDEKKADVKRLAIKEARLEALEAADNYHLEETKEGKQKVKSDYEKELDEKIKNLTSEKNKEEETVKSTPLEKAKKSVEDKINAIRKEISDKERQKKEEKEKFQADNELNRLKEVEKALSDLRDKYLPKEKEKFSDEKSLKQRRKSLLNEISNLNDQINSKTRKAKDKTVEDTEEIKKLKDIKKQKTDLLDIVAPDIEKINKDNKKIKDKIDEINREISYVKQTKSVYEQAIQDPKKASEALLAAREERDRTYASLGLKLEKNAKSPILIERDYQAALKEIKDSNLSDAEKDIKIEELSIKRNADLQGTKQGVVSSLSDDIVNYIDSNLKNPDLNNNLRSILNGLEPTGEKLDDQINKAYTKLNKLLEDESLSKEERKSINEIITDLENNNQLTSDQLSAKRLQKQWENEIRKSETDIASGNFTKIPNNTYDYRRNDQLVILNKARENKTGQYNRLVADAKEKNRTKAEKALDLSTKFLVSGIHTASKVLEAATFKPFMDSVVDLTAGNIASYLFTGAPKTSFYSIKKGYKTFAAFKNKEEAQKYIQKLQNDRDTALNKLQEANESGNQSAIKKADKEFKKADLEYAVSTLYNSIETNVLNSFWQYVKHGATDYDVNIGKSSKKDISEYRTILGKTGYVLDGWIRLHGAMKSSLSARPEMMKVFSSTLKDFQNKGKELSPENISLAMVLAADAYEAGRLTNKTALSKMISRGKGSEKSTMTRLITKGLMPVSTIAVNLAKRGIDYSTLGAEGFVRLATETRKGMKLNEVEGKTYDGIISRIKDGWNRMPLKERAYINGVIGRGLFGSAMMLVTAYGLSNGMIKYGGTFEDQRKRKIMASDGEQLKAGEWEFFGERMPKAASLFLNHLPEFLTISLIADNYQINQMGGTGGEKFETTIDEIEARLPFQTIAGVFVPGRRVNTLVDRFTRIPIAAEAATLFDEKAEFRDKSDFINRIRGNIGLGFLNATKEQQKDIDEIKKELRGLPPGQLTPEFESKVDKIIEIIKNTDYKELENKKMEEEYLKKIKDSKKQ